jgi:hypothetical protein
MILPTKNLDQSRALIEVGGEILHLLALPKTISSLWENFKLYRVSNRKSAITYDWFILALDFLYIIEAIEYESGKLTRVDTNATQNI